MFYLQDNIKEKLSMISTFPNSGTSITSYLNDVANEFSEIRKLNVGNYTLLYFYTEISDIASVAHIFHQTQDYGKIFQ